MGHCEVSSEQFDELKLRLERVVEFLGIEEIDCPETVSMDEPKGSWRRPSRHAMARCETCNGYGTVWRKRAD